MSWNRLGVVISVEITQLEVVVRVVKNGVGMDPPKPKQLTDALRSPQVGQGVGWVGNWKESVRVANYGRNE